MKRNYLLMSGLMIALLSFVTIHKVHAQLYINEFMASNDTAFAGLLGDYADWIEIYNAGSEDVMLGGYYMSDNLTDTSSWYAIPVSYADSTTVPAGGFLVFYANKKEDVSIMCLNFKLKGSGEQIGLWDPNKVVVDTLSFGQQTTDISYGRFPDGNTSWFFMNTYTPGAANQYATGINMTKAEVSLSQNYPNPFDGSTKIDFTLQTGQQVTLSVFDLTGKEIQSVSKGYFNAGIHSVVWDAKNLPTGIYYYKLQSGQNSWVKKAMIVR